MSSAVSHTAGVSSSVWPRFDPIFLYGTAGLALLIASVVSLQPAAFLALYIGNYYLLGTNHVIATFTRIAFDRKDAKEHSFLLFVLPWICLAGVAAITLTSGGWMVISLYFYWQAFHYVRQSWGIALRYGSEPGNPAVPDIRATQAVIYLVPLWGILNRSHQGWDVFLNMDIALLPVAGFVVDGVGVLAVLSIGWWLSTVVRAHRSGQPLPAHFVNYVATHILVFVTGYVLISSLDAGWLVLNVWHNTQYILFVWKANAKRFEGGVDPEHKLISHLSQGDRILLGMVICFFIATLAYAGIGLAGQAFPLEALIGIPFLFGMTINFHHYIVDGVIWKRRGRPESEIA